MVVPRYATRAADVAVDEVRTTKDRDDFIRYPLERYAHDPMYVPPLVAERREFIDPQQNPYFARAEAMLFVARRYGAPVGRIAAVIDQRYNQFHRVNVGFVGMFESADDPGIASALLSAAGEWLRKRGVREAMGPVNLAFHHDVGLLVEGFDRPPSMMMPYNPPSYAGLFEANGFRKLKDLFSYEVTAQTPLPPKMTRLADRVRQSGLVTVRTIDMSQASTEARRIKGVYDSMLKPGFGFAPISEEEFSHMVNRLRPLVSMRPELSLVAEVAGEAVAFSITVPDSNLALKAAGGYLSKYGLPIGLAKFLWAARKADRLRMLLFAIKPGFRRRGIDALLTVETMETARRLGFASAELGWVREDDTLVTRAVHAAGARRIRVYRIYSRPI